MIVRDKETQHDFPDCEVRKTFLKCATQKQTIIVKYEVSWSQILVFESTESHY